MTPGEIAEIAVLWVVTGGYLLYFAVFVFVTWAERPLTGRDEHGILRVWRDVRQR